MDQGENTKAPEEMRLIGGAFGFRPVIVSVRLNPASPYRIEAEDGALILRLDGDS